MKVTIYLGFGYCLRNDFYGILVVAGCGFSFIKVTLWLPLWDTISGDESFLGCNQCTAVALHLDGYLFRGSGAGLHGAVVSSFQQD